MESLLSCVVGVNIPAATVTSLLQEQGDWEKKCQKASSMESLHKKLFSDLS